MRLIWAVDHALQRASKQMERTIGVTGPQRLVLRIVGRFPGVSAGDLARLLHLHPSTLTGIVARLEKQGSIRRRSDPRDRRRISLGLTNRGRSFDVAAEGTIEAAVSRVLAGVSAEKIRATREVLLAIADALDESPAETEQDRSASDWRGSRSSSRTASPERRRKTNRKVRDWS
jgi:DNA-binding MarR family transcriptional regulator